MTQRRRLVVLGGIALLAFAGLWMLVSDDSSAAPAELWVRLPDPKSPDEDAAIEDPRVAPDGDVVSARLVHDSGPAGFARWAGPVPQWRRMLVSIGFRSGAQGWQAQYGRLPDRDVAGVRWIGWRYLSSEPDEMYAPDDEAGKPVPAPTRRR